MKYLQTLAAAVLAAAAIHGSAQAKPAGVGQPTWAGGSKPGSSSIVQIVLAPDGEFDVLQAAVVKAGLVNALDNGQYTVFAPTDAAFVTTLGVANEAEAIAAVNALPVEVLTKILLYHIVEGRRNSRSVLAAREYETLSGLYLSRAELLDAGIAATDISASNGIVHVINHVLLPPNN